MGEVSTLTGGDFAVENRLAFEVFVEIDPGQVTGVSGEAESVCVIPFTGTVKGALFNGTVAPGGADVQTRDARGALHVSARYALTGTDHTGRPCRIYIHNEGRFEDGKLPSPFHTTPSFVTDSPALAERFRRFRYRGEGHDGEGSPYGSLKSGKRG